MDLENNTAVPDDSPVPAFSDDLLTVSKLAEEEAVGDSSFNEPLDETLDFDISDDAEPDAEALDAEALEAETPATIIVSAAQRGPRLDVRDVVSYFAACGRCGYFLSGYWATNGREDLETAVHQAKSGWITLSWNQTVRELVLKSYASDIEANDLHYEGCCSECRRHFIFRASRSPNHPDTLRIEVKPRKRQ